MRAPAVLAAALVILLGGSTSALAHGDPPSHYLETEPLYPAFADRPSQAVELELLGLLQASERGGYPIKVALIASRDDLTEDPAMLHRPQAYADRIASTVAARVLVVTPYGFGVARAGRADRLGPRPAATGDALARAAMTAVRRLTRAAGHPLPADVPPAAAIAAAAGGGGGPGHWLPWLVGPLVFVLAWLGYEVWSRSGRSG